ncbi:MAG: hypothetical protein DMG07_10105 [Acidobacteria bacterium]|nr:MAG: hypothetical protein DMG07_10105 [Acidobacteriota bacterium]
MGKMTVPTRSMWAIGAEREEQDGELNHQAADVETMEEVHPGGAPVFRVSGATKVPTDPDNSRRSQELAL